MKKYIEIPSNYVKRNDGETVRTGDIYQNFRGEIGKCVHSIGATVGDEGYDDFTFYRRLRNKKSDTVRISAVPTYGYCEQRQSKGRATRKPAKVEVVDVTTEKSKVPTVEFEYDGQYRIVRVISMDEKYLKGLESIWTSKATIKWQFKTFQRNKISGYVTLLSYVPAK